MYKNYLDKNTSCNGVQNFPTQLPGVPGPRGVTGIQGHTGSTGPSGPTGPIGKNGRGPIGPTGSASTTVTVEPPIVYEVMSDPKQSVVFINPTNVPSSIVLDTSYNLLLDSYGRVVSLTEI